MGKKTVKQVKHSIRGMIDCHISLTQDMALICQMLFVWEFQIHLVLMFG